MKLAPTGVGFHRVQSSARVGIVRLVLSKAGVQGISYRLGISIARAIRLLDLFVRLISFDLFTRLIPLRGLGAWRSSVYQVTLFQS